MLSAAQPRTTRVRVRSVEAPWFRKSSDPRPARAARRSGRRGVGESRAPRAVAVAHCQWHRHAVQRRLGGPASGRVGGGRQPERAGPRSCPLRWCWVGLPVEQSPRRARAVGRAPGLASGPSTARANRRQPSMNGVAASSLSPKIREMSWLRQLQGRVAPRDGRRCSGSSRGFRLWSGLRRLTFEVQVCVANHNFER
jgi:hypothetical protein